MSLFGVGMITSLSKKKRKKGKEGKEKGKGKEGRKGKKEGERKEIGKKKEKDGFGSHRKISKTFLGKDVIFFPSGKEYIFFEI